MKRNLEWFFSCQTKYTLNRRQETKYCIMIKWSIQKEDITLVNIYAYNIWAPKYINHIFTDLNKVYSNTVIIEVFNSPLISIDRSSRQKINKEALSLNDTLDIIKLIDVYRTNKTQREWKERSHKAQSRNKLKRD